MDAATLSPGPSEMSARITAAPSAASLSAVAAPMPEAAPVTTATLSAKRGIPFMVRVDSSGSAVLS